MKGGADLKEVDYAYPVAVVRSREGRLLSAQELESLAVAESCEKCLAHLRDKGWEQGSESEVLDAERKKTWDFIKEVAPDFEEFGFLVVKNDFHNLKAALKSLVSQCDFTPFVIEPCLVDLELMKKAVEERDFELLPDYMCEQAKAAYIAITEQSDGQLCEMILDKAALETAIALSKKSGDLAEKLAQLEAFEADIKIAYRCCRMKKSPAVIKLALAECGRLDCEVLSEAAAQGMPELLAYLETVSKDAAQALEKAPSLFSAYIQGMRGGILEAYKHENLSAAPIINYILRREEEVAKVRLALARIRSAV